MNADHTRPNSEWFQDLVRRFEAAFSSAGGALPPGLTPSQFVAALIEDMARDLERWGPEFQRITEQVREELGPTASPDEFIARLTVRVQQWVDTHPYPNGTAASA